MTPRFSHFLLALRMILCYNRSCISVPGGLLFSMLSFSFASCSEQAPSGAISYLADFGHDYGIIPYPKYDEAQAAYKSMVDGSHSAMAVGKDAQDLDFIGILTEAYCAESYKKVLPAYYDVCLKQRYASSPKDAEMMDLCVNARVFDPGYVYDNWNGVAFYFQELLRAAQFQDITSYYKSREKAATKYYEKVLKLFDGE